MANAYSNKKGGQKTALRCHLAIRGEVPQPINPWNAPLLILLSRAPRVIIPTAHQVTPCITYSTYPLKHIYLRQVPVISAHIHRARKVKMGAGKGISPHSPPHAPLAMSATELQHYNNHSIQLTRVQHIGLPGFGRKASSPVRDSHPMCVSLISLHVRCSWIPAIIDNALRLTWALVG